MINISFCRFANSPIYLFINWPANQFISLFMCIPALIIYWYSYKLINTSTGLSVYQFIHLFAYHFTSIYLSIDKLVDQIRRYICWLLYSTVIQIIMSINLSANKQGKLITCIGCRVGGSLWRLNGSLWHSHICKSMSKDFDFVPKRQNGYCCFTYSK